MTTKKSNGEGTIYVRKRNGKNYYTGQVTIGIDENGNQIRKSFCGYKRADVVKEMKEAQFYVDKNIYTDTKDLTFGEYLYEWLYTTKKLELAPLSFERYESIYKNKIKTDQIHRIKLSELSTMNLQKFFNNLIEIKKESYNSANYIKTTLKTALEDAVKSGVLFRNPINGVKIKKEEKQKNYNIFTVEEQELLISSLKLTDTVDLVIYTALSTGLRLGELLALKWTDFDGSKLDINKQLQNVYEEDNGSKKQVKKLLPLKTKDSKAILPIPQKVAKELQKHRLRQSEMKLRLGKAYQDEDFIFADDIGQPIDRKRPGRKLSKICKDLNIPHRTFHSLRHTYCTRLFEAGVPIKTVQALMRHSNSQTTLDIYTHVMPEQKDKAILLLEKYL